MLDSMYEVRIRRHLSALLFALMSLMLTVILMGSTSLAKTETANTRDSSGDTLAPVNGQQTAQHYQPQQSLHRATPSDDVCWNIVTSPRGRELIEGLNAVAAISSNDVWAVGNNQDTGCGGAPLIEHWDGTAWSVVDGPNVIGQFFGVAAISSNDVWAVGQNSYCGSSSTLIEHWNGAAWSVVDSPNPGTWTNHLYGVVALSSSNVWAVGDYVGVDTGQTLIEHWNGTTWSVFASSGVIGSNNQLLAVAAVSSNDVWAVGNSQEAVYPQVVRPLIEHWDGSSWSMSTIPNIGDRSFLYGVAAVSPSDVWAVGGYTYNDSSDLTLVEHWNGSSWSAVQSRNPSTNGNTLSAVAAVSSNDVWAVGSDSAGNETLTEHWDGIVWSVVSSPNGGLRRNSLNALVVVSPNDIRAVGTYQDTSNGFEWWPLVEQNTCSTSPPALQGPPVILVHGWTGLDPVGNHCNANGSGNEVVHFTDTLALRNKATQYWGQFPDWLLEAHYDVWVAELTSYLLSTSSLETNGHCLSNQISYVYSHTYSNSHQKPLIIAHSMGGLVGRAALRDQTTAHEVQGLYTIQSPHAGLPAATLANFLSPFAYNGLLCLAQQGGCEMSATRMVSFNRDHPNVSGIAYGFIGGSYTPLISLLPFGPTPNDGFVSSLSGTGLDNDGQFDPPDWASASMPSQYRVSEVHNGNFVDWNGGRNSGAYAPTESRPRNSGEPSYSYNCIQYMLNRVGPPPLGCIAASTGPQTLPGKGSSSSGTGTGTAHVATPPDLTQLLEPVSGHILPGQYYSQTVMLDTAGAAQSSLSWLTGTLAFTLTQPDGTVIDPSYAISHPDIVAYGYSAGSDSFPPTASYYFTATNQTGMWTLSVQGASLPSSGTDYTASTSVEGSRSLTVGTNKAQYNAGESALISATILSSGVGLPGASVLASVGEPDGVTQTLTLADMGNGTYNASYQIPSEPGLISISVQADGIDGGTSFTRFAEAVAAISPQDARVSGPYSYQTLNNNGDQLYESLAVTSTVTATTATTYTLYADLTAGNQQVTVAHTSAYLHLAPGSQVITLFFDGNDIRASHLSGPYTVTHVSLVNTDLGITAQSLDSVLTTLAYNWQQFGGCFTLTTLVNPSIGGVVTADPSPSCSAGTQYSVDSTVTLTATANTGYAFADWSRDITGTTSIITTTISADKTVQANFAPVSVLLGHVTWQGRPAQPSTLQSLPITLTVRLQGGGGGGGADYNFPMVTTDPSGFFTVSVGTLPVGTYNWRVKGPNGTPNSNTTPGFLANAGTLTLSGAATTQVEMGLMRAGDANNDNLVNATDYVLLRNTYGRIPGQQGYDPRADFNGDNLVNATDYVLLRTNYGAYAPGPLGPGGPQGPDGSSNSPYPIPNPTVAAPGTPGTPGVPAPIGPPAPMPSSTPTATRTALPAGAPSLTATPTATPRYTRAFLELRPQGKGPANGGTVKVGDSFVLELWLNPGAYLQANPGFGSRPVAQDSYLSFTSSVLQNIKPNTAGSGPKAGAGPGIEVWDAITADPSIFESEQQNEVCNGPGECVFRGIQTASGTIAFASGTYKSEGQIPSKPFKIGQITLYAASAGKATLHWQLGPLEQPGQPGGAGQGTGAPGDPGNRASKIVDANGNELQNRAMFVDYSVNAVR